ncbi:MAG: NPCBM/NEW2 domain-containing protein [Planctomycetota bacterium]
MTRQRLALCSLLLTIAFPAAAQNPPVPVPVPVPAPVEAPKPKPKATGIGATLLSGEEIPGALRDIQAGGLSVGSRKEPIPQFELQEIRLSKAETAPPRRKASERPLVRFRTGETVSARIVAVAEEQSTLRVGGVGDLQVPLEILQAFRLREVHPKDPLFEEDLEKEPPKSDTVYVRRSNLLRVTGTFRGLTDEHLLIERGGRVRRLKRNLVQGVILAPLASRAPNADPPAVLDYRGLGQLPAHLVGVTKKDDGKLRALQVKFPGSKTTQLLPFDGLERISFASDRVVFLSTLTPTKTTEVAVVGKALAHRKDRSVDGGPLKMAGRTYRKGLGVHSRCVLEYALVGQYQSFAAVIGLDDSSEGRGSVTFRVFADEKPIFEKEVNGKDDPIPLSLSVSEVNSLRLEVDFGKDGLDTGDHADWASARLTK